jgi:NADH dehydrogenase
MDVLVAGGTGFVGRHLCRLLDDRGHDVTVLSRDPDPSTVPSGVSTVAADVTEDDLDPHCEGRDAVVNLVALSPLFQPRGRTHDAVHVGGTRALVDASESTGVGRFLQTSALGADPDGATAYLRAKGRAENVVVESGLDWTVFRPSVVFGDGGEFVSFTKRLTTPYVTGLPGGGRTRFQPIWVGDLTPMLADAIEDDTHVGAVYEIGGPERLTLADVAKLAHRADGRSLTVVPVPMALAKLGLSVAGGVPGVPFGADQYRSLRMDNVTDENDATAFGVDPSDMRTLADHLGVASVAAGTASA